MTDNITVHCLVLGDTPPDECVFPIDVAKGDTIFELQKTIKAEKENDFANIDANKLRLWKVNIPLNILNEKLDALKDYPNVNIEKMLGGEVLRPISKICKAFPDELSDECIHIIIQHSSALYFPGSYPKENDDNFRLKTEDPQRIEVALLVSQAIYKENPVQFLTNKSMIELKEICVADKNDIETPYLIAFSTKEVYIAFRGTWIVQNWIESMSTLPNFTGYKGKIHSGFKRIAERIPLDLLTRITIESKRITLCGHSHGGAVSHIYLLLYFIFCSSGGFTLPEDLDILSIAFGSPFVADNEIRKWLRGRQNFAKCFCTFVHKNDGVPQSLNLVNNISGQDSPIQHVYDKIIIFVKNLGLVFPKIEAIKEHLEQTKHLYEEFSNNPIIKTNVTDLYQPFGLWFFCEKNTYTIFDASSQPDDIIEKLKEIKLDDESIRDHNIDKYYTVLKSTFDFSSNIYDNENNEIQIKGGRFYPIIKSVNAELHKSYIPRVVIHITGYNLNFLSKPAVELKYSTSDIERLTPAKASSKEILMDSHSLIVEGSVSKSKPRNCTLQINSHFGTNEPWQIKKKDWKIKTLKHAEKFVNEAVEGLLHKAIQRCFISSKNDSGNVTDYLLKSVAKLECVVLNRKVSKIEKSFTDCLKFKISDGLLEMEKKTNPICSDIIKEISSEIPIKTENGINTYLISAFIIVAGTMVSGGMAVIAGLIAEDAVATSIIGGLICSAICLKRILDPLYTCEAQYRSIIKFLLEQLKPLDSMKETKEIEYSINSPFDTEEKIVYKWKELGYMDMDSNKIIKNMPFRSDEKGLYKEANYNSKEKALHRINSIIHLHDVRRKLLEHAFVTAIGPQNAGKTTALVELFPGIRELPNKDTIKIGLGSHTEDPVTYEFEHLSVVDFPGLNSVNKDESSAPNIKLPERLRNSIRQSGILASIILCIFKFEGSVNAELKELVNLVEPYLGEVPVLLCLNQAVEKMGASDGLKNLESVNNWRNRIINELGISKESKDKLEIQFTDFVSKNHDSINCGIWSTDNVMQWIREKIRGQLFFIKKDVEIDKILGAATEKKFKSKRNFLFEKKL